MPKKRKKTKKSNSKISPSRIIEKVDYSKVNIELLYIPIPLF